MRIPFVDAIQYAGLAVDDAIHFMHNFRRCCEWTGSVDDAVRKTLSSTGQGMLFTTPVLSPGFFSYVFSSMDNISDFGLPTGFTIITAYLADVPLAPALMALVIDREPLPAMRVPGMEGT